jgi:hypothetical protein
MDSSLSVWFEQVPPIAVVPSTFGVQAKAQSSIVSKEDVCLLSFPQKRTDSLLINNVTFTDGSSIGATNETKL